MNDLYETDTLLWSEQQAEALRAAARSGANLPIDWEHVAEAIGALAKSERSTLASQVNTVIEHLATLEASPAVDPRNGWIEAVLRTRNNIEDVLKSSPSLRQTLAKVIAEEHPRVLRLVCRVLAIYGETPRVPLDGSTIVYSRCSVPGCPAMRQGRQPNERPVRRRYRAVVRGTGQSVACRRAFRRQPADRLGKCRRGD